MELKSFSWNKKLRIQYFFLIKSKIAFLITFLNVFSNVFFFCNPIWAVVYPGIFGKKSSKKFLADEFTD